MAAVYVTVEADCSELQRQAAEAVELTQSLKRLFDRVLCQLDGLTADDIDCRHAAAAAGARNRIALAVSSGKLENIVAALRALPLDFAHKALDSIEAQPTCETR